MSSPNLASTNRFLPLLLGACGVVALGIFWLTANSDSSLKLRVPGTDQAPGSDLGTNANAVAAGRLSREAGQPANLPGTWPQFRGPERNGISPETVPLARSWQSGPPKELWGVDLGEGYAGAAVQAGRVYVMDYDQTNRQDALRCFSLEDGRELWRFAYANPVKRNHGMSRTTPAVTEKLVVAIGPKCHVACLDPVTGDLRWGLDLVRQYGATVPPWYAGQCPLIDQGKVVLAPGGKEVLLLAVEGETGKPVWTTPNPRGWKMTHSSIMPMEIGGERMYVYCANNGVVGVSAENGSLLWETTDWKISIATVPSPLVLDGGRIFFSGGYNAGSLMLQVSKEGNRYATRTLFRLEPEVFGATQHTPILYENHIYGVRPDGKFVCLTTDGRTVWSGDASGQLGLGPFLLADGVIFAMNDSGMLCLLEATSEKCNLLGKAQVLHGRESWAPLALAGGRLLARDLTRMVCLDVGRR
jgi:outer membrane protein assembly factor BamB